MLVDVKNEAEIKSFRGILTPGQKIGPNEQATRALDAGFHALSRSVELRNLPLLQALLHAGLDTSKQDLAGRTPLHEAALHDFDPAVALLKAFGANLNAHDNVGAAPLHLTAICKSAAVARALIEGGADINFKNNVGHTPLMSAVANAHGDVSVVDLLISQKVDVNALDPFKKSPLMHAADEGDWMCAKSLIDAGADVHLANDNDWQAIHCASFSGQSDFSDRLRSMGVSIDTASIAGMTPLLVALENNHFEHAIHLIKSGADVHACRDSDGTTALHLAAEMDQREVGMALLERGADLDRPDKFNASALKTAKAVGNDDWVEQMQAFVASMRARKALDAIFSATTAAGERVRSMTP
jgi:ankyrin repeat protein